MPAPTRSVTPQHYLELLDALVPLARALVPAPDSVVGIKRSGLFPAVVLSHRLGLPFFTGTEARWFPYPRLAWPLIVDTVAWTGETLRRCQHRLARCGVPPDRLRVLVMFARHDPPPPVPQLHWLATATRIPQFWYASEEGLVPPTVGLGPDPGPES